MSSIPLAPNAAQPTRTIVGADSYADGMPLFPSTYPGTALDYTVQWGAWAAQQGRTLTAGAVVVPSTSGLAVLSSALSPTGDLVAQIVPTLPGIWPVMFQILLNDGSQQVVQVLLPVLDSVNTLTTPITSPAGPFTDANGILVTAS